MTEVREQQFREEADSRNLKLPPYICAHGLSPYARKKEEVSYDIDFENVELAINWEQVNFDRTNELNRR